MRRFSLRSMLIIAAVLPPVIAGVWYWGQFGKVHAGSQEKAARAKLLAYTPAGTSAKNVLGFVIKDLYRPGAGQGNAYFQYLQDYEASNGRAKLNLTPTDDRTIEVIVSSTFGGFLMADEVKATWHFDRKDRLIDITTSSYSIGP
jgi:hypothetical protein